MGRLKHKLNGTTLIETIVSMMLIVLIMTIVIQIIGQVNREIGSDIKPYAYFMVRQYLNKTYEDVGYSEFKEENSAITITRNLSIYENHDELLLLNVKAVDMRGTVIISAKRIISRYELKNTPDKKY